MQSIWLLYNLKLLEFLIINHNIVQFAWQRQWPYNKNFSVIHHFTTNFNCNDNILGAMKATSHLMHATLLATLTTSYWSLHIALFGSMHIAVVATVTCGKQTLINAFAVRKNIDWIKHLISHGWSKLYSCKLSIA